jgi:putative transposase
MSQHTKEAACQTIRRLELPKLGSEYALEAVTAGPSRSVFSPNRRSVVGRFFSRKMQETRQYESSTVEKRLLIFLEADPNVIYYVTQPPAVHLTKLDKRNRRITTQYTPDALAIRADRITLYEGKTSAFLSGCAEDDNWEESPSGAYSFLPAKTYFQNLGIEYLVFSSTDLTPQQESNYNLLSKIALYDQPEDPIHFNQLQALLQTYSWLSIGEAVRKLSLPSLDLIFSALAKRIIYADLNRQLISDTSTLITGDPKVVPLLATDEMQKDLLTPGYIPTQKEIAEAMIRLNFSKSHPHTRQGQRYRKLIKDGQQKGQHPIQSLIPKTQKKGNRTAKISPEQKKLVADHIDETLLARKTLSIRTSWQHYCEQLKEHASLLPPVSLTTYTKYYNLIDRAERELALKGNRGHKAAAKHSRPQDRRGQATHALESCCIDHCLLKVYACLVTSKDHIIVARPWLTSVIDHFSGAILANHISFRAPSRLAVAAVFRTILNDYGKLPEALHMDNGAEFHSAYTTQLNAFFGITTSFSPPGRSRFNSAVERTFRSLRERAIKPLPGTIIDYDKRHYSDSMRPQNAEIFTLTDFIIILESFKSTFNQTLAGSHSEPRILRFSNSLLLSDHFGVARPKCKDTEFLATCVPISSYSIAPNGSLLYSGRNYYHPALRGLSQSKTSLSPRIDPLNPYIVAFRLDKQWAIASASQATSFRTLPTTERLSQAIWIHSHRRYTDESKLLTARTHDSLVVEMADKLGIAGAHLSEFNKKNAEPDASPRVTQFDNARDLYTNASFEVQYDRN